MKIEITNWKQFTLFVLVALALCTAGMIYGGWVFALVWGWLVVPVFGLPAITIAQAIGLKLVVSALTFNLAKEKEEDEGINDLHKLGRYIGKAFGTPTVFLCVAYTVSLFV